MMQFTLYVTKSDQIKAAYVPKAFDIDFYK